MVGESGPGVSEYNTERVWLWLSARGQRVGEAEAGPGSMHRKEQDWVKIPVGQEPRGLGQGIARA